MGLQECLCPRPASSRTVEVSASAPPVLSGTVRVSTGECAAGFLARCLSGSTTTALPSGISLELVESRQTANLARREADLALRHRAASALRRRPGRGHQ